jgi:hypothetical protein
LLRSVLDAKAEIRFYCWVRNASGAYNLVPEERFYSLEERARDAAEFFARVVGDPSDEQRIEHAYRKATTLDIEDVGALQSAFEELLSKIRSAFPQVRETDITVDVTGGPKWPSIAGALVTVGRAITAQYVRGYGLKAVGAVSGKELVAYDLDVASRAFEQI